MKGVNVKKIEKALGNTSLEAIGLYLEILAAINQLLKNTNKEKVINFLTNLNEHPRGFMRFLIKTVEEDRVQIAIKILREARKIIKTRQPRQEQSACLRKNHPIKQ